LHLRRTVIIVIASVGFGLGSLCLMGGCGDDSKTTGTMVERDEKEKAALDNMRAAMKEGKAAQKQQDAEEKKKPK